MVEDISCGLGPMFTLEHSRMEVIDAAVKRRASCEPWFVAPVHAVGNGHDGAVGAGDHGKGVGNGISVVVHGLVLPLVQCDGEAIGPRVRPMPVHDSRNLLPWRDGATTSKTQMNEKLPQFITLLSYNTEQNSSHTVFSGLRYLI